MTEARRLDEDAEGFEEHFDDADDEAFPYVQQYYASLSPNPGRGSGFFDARLANFHEGPNLPKDRHYFSVPKSLSHLKRDPSSTPRDHPLRAIAWVLHNAPQDSVVRVFCYSLTDPIAIDLLIKAGFTREVKVILHPNEKSKRAMKEFVDQHGKNAFLENMEIRLANLSGSPCESRLVQMHVKSIITEDYTTYGSYNLSSFARVGNWESLYVADTHQTCREAFDAIWETLLQRQAERFYADLQSTAMGPRRTARKIMREAEAGRRASVIASREEQGQQEGHDHCGL